MTRRGHRYGLTFAPLSHFEISGRVLLDIFRMVRHGGRLSLDQLKVMSAIKSCRTAALGGLDNAEAACQLPAIVRTSF